MCLSELVERLATAAEKRVEAKLSGEALMAYRAGEGHAGAPNASRG